MTTERTASTPEPTTTEEVAAAPAEPTDATAQPDTGAQSEPEDSSRGERSPNAEAAKRRRQLREVESERDLLRSQLDQAHRREVERMVGDRLHSPADLWLVVRDLGDLRNSAGELDPATIDARVYQLMQERPHWAKPPLDLHQGARRSVTVSAGPSFARALKGAARG